MNPAVYTTIILPNEALKPYVSFYAHRSFDTKGLVFKKAMIADNEILINFFLKGNLHGYEEINKSNYSFNRNNTVECYLSAVQTSTKGFILFKELTNILSVHFKPAGLYNIFGISPKELRELFGETSFFIGNEINLVYEQMLEKIYVSDCIDIIQVYLFKKLSSRKQKHGHLSIPAAANLLIEQKGIYSMSKLSNELNMSQQTMGVHFKNQVGVDAKNFCRLIRFKQAVKMKIYNPSLSWTSITYSCGFYDQMHLIKDFKNFTGLSPNEFLRIINPPVEQFG